MKFVCVTLALLSTSGCRNAKYYIPGAMTHSGCNTGYACIQVYQLEAKLLKEIRELRGIKYPICWECNLSAHGGFWEFTLLWAYEWKENENDLSQSLLAAVNQRS